MILVMLQMMHNLTDKSVVVIFSDINCPQDVICVNTTFTEWRFWVWTHLPYMHTIKQWAMEESNSCKKPEIEKPIQVQCEVIINIVQRL